MPRTGYGASQGLVLVEFSPDGRALAFNREADGVLLVSLADDGCRVVLPPGATPPPVPVRAARVNRAGRPALSCRVDWHRAVRHGQSASP